jgi:hypothetical protein
MVPIEMRLKAERRMRQILAEEQKAQPDTVLYGEACVLFHWNGGKHSIVVDVGDDGEIMESRVCEPPSVARGYELVSNHEEAPTTPDAA